MTATVTGQFLGIPGNGKQVRFRTLHVFEFRDRRISRENLWLDGAGLAAQLRSYRARRSRGCDPFHSLDGEGCRPSSA